MKLAKKKIGPVLDDEKQFMLEQIDRLREHVLSGRVTGFGIAVSYIDGGAGTTYKRANVGSHFTLLGAVHRLSDRINKILGKYDDD